MASMERYGSLGARAALATIFVISGLGKLLGPEGAAAYIAAKGLPAPMLLALLAGVTELAGGSMLVVGLRTRLAAVGLALFLVPATVLFHNPFGLTGAEAHMQQIQALNNLAIAGGLVALATWGAGAISLDAWRERRGRSLARAIPQPTRAAVSG